MAEQSSRKVTSQASFEGRFATLESAVSNVALQLGDFIKESKEHRERIELEQSRIWGAIEKQGQSLASAVEKLTARGQMSWPIVMSTITLVVVLVSAGATVNSRLTEERIKQVELRAEGIREVREAVSARIQAEIGHANADSIQRHDTQQESIDALSAEVADLRKHDLEAAELRGKLLSYHEWLRDDAEAIKEDLKQHADLPGHPQGFSDVSRLQGEMDAVREKLKEVHDAVNRQ